MAATSSLIPFDNNSQQVANDNSLLEIDRELDALLERIEDEIEEHGEASKEAMDLLQVFVDALNLKVDRIVPVPLRHGRPGGLLQEGSHAND